MPQNISMNRRLALLFAAALLAPAQAQEGRSSGPLARKYQEDEPIAYDIRATHRGRAAESQYTAKVRGLVRRDAAGIFHEELAWGDLQADGQPIPLPAEAERFRQRVSLDPRAPLRVPRLAEIHPALAGPVFDLVNFYGDLKLAARTPGLAKPGDKVRIPHNRANSWADGRNVLVGEDALDFEISLDAIEAGKATITVRHVPPENPAINLSAEWMNERVVPSAANNWTQLGRYPQGKYTAAVGVETIEVKLVVDTGSGRIVSGTLTNPVEIVERECEDLEARRCGEPVRRSLMRRIELTAKP